MINFHWMAKGSYSKEELISLMDNIDSYSYKSILLPFQVFKNEPIISASFLADNYKNIKFMVAIRPYTISSLHLSMMVKTFYDLYGDRLILNFVAGTFDEEYKLFTGSNSSIQDRKEAVHKYIEDFINYCEGNKYAEIAVSGSSHKSIETSNKLADYSINLFSDFDKINNSSKHNIFRMSFAIDKNKNECIFANDKETNNSFCGNEKDIHNFLNNCRDKGITDMLVSTLFSETNAVDKLHKILHNYRMES